MVGGSRGAADGSREVRAVSPAANQSDLQTAQIRNAGFHHVQVHFDVIISDAADFRSGENPLPIESSLPHRNNLLGLCGPALDVHGDEPAWIFHEIAFFVKENSRDTYLAATTIFHNNFVYFLPKIQILDAGSPNPIFYQPAGNSSPVSLPRHKLCYNIQE